MSIFAKHFFYLLLSVSSTLSEFFHWTPFINIINKIRSNFEKHWLFTIYRVHSNRWACLQASSFMNVLHFATTNWIVCAKNANFEVWTKQLGKTLVWNFYRVVLLEYRITFMKFVENHWNLLYKLIKKYIFHSHIWDDAYIYKLISACIQTVSWHSSFIAAHVSPCQHQHKISVLICFQ